MKRWLLWTLGVLAVVVIGLVVGYKLMTSRKPVAQFETTKIERGSVVARVTATGTVSALVTVQVGSQVSGRIKALYADYNSAVKKGQMLAQIDPQMFQASMAQANANHVAAMGNLARAEASAEIAKIQYDRSKQLFDKNLVAQADLDTARTAVLTAQADVVSAKGSVQQASASVTQARVNLAYTDIVCPIDGVVISRNVDVGQTVAASLQAPVIFQIAGDLSKMQVDTSVAEADIGKLEPNMPATFTVDAFPGTQFKGTVRQIRNAPVTVQNVVTYDAVIDVENPELKLRPGMTATVTFVYAERTNTLRVSNAALRFRPSAEVIASASPSAGASASASAHNGAGSGKRRADNGSGAAASSDRKAIWLVQGNLLHRASIKTGISDGTYTEIVEGDVKEGDAVATGTSSGSTGGASTATGGGSQQRSGGGMGRML